jgi:hypothetical protein
MSETMIERVAGALQKASALERGGEGILSLSTCRLIAITAIAAMREPSEEMIDAINITTAGLDLAEYVKRDWYKMIDAALSEEDTKLEGARPTGE